MATVSGASFASAPRTAAGNGFAIIKQAYDNSVGKPNCVITVAPKSLPVFESPFASNGVTFVNGVMR